MNVFQAILARRSVRGYKPDAVDSTLIRCLLEAAVRAPSAMHQEPWAFVIVQDKKLLRTLSDIAKPLVLAEIRQSASESTRHHLDIFGQDDFNVFYDAGTLIIICGHKDSPFFEADCWLAAENLMLSACAMGLGSCVIGSALPAFKTDDVKSRLRIPPEFSAVAPIILGYASNEVAPTSRKSPVVLANIAATH